VKKTQNQKKSKKLGGEADEWGGGVVGSWGECIRVGGVDEFVVVRRRMNLRWWELRRWGEK
jgi:hypothetical protein